MPCNPYANLANGPLGRRFSLSCDEFPFANSLQGGNPTTGTSICIPGWENSFQGGKLNQIGKTLSAGDDYVVELSGWDCSAGEPLPGIATNCGSGGIPKRDNAMLYPGDSLTGADLFPNFTSTGQGALMLYLGDVMPGVYNYILDVGAGNFTDVVALDNSGNILASLENGLQTNSETQTVSFRLNNSADAVSLWVLTTDLNVSVSYNVTSTPLSSSGARPRRGDAQTIFLFVIPVAFVLLISS